MQLEILEADSIQLVGGKIKELYVDRDMKGSISFNEIDFVEAEGKDTLILDFRGEFNNCSIAYSTTKVTGPITFNNVDIRSTSLYIDHAEAKLRGVKSFELDSLKIIQAHTLETKEGIIDTESLDLTNVQNVRMDKLQLNGGRPSLTGVRLVASREVQLEVLAAEKFEVIGGTVRGINKIVNAENVSFSSVTFENNDQFIFDSPATFRNNVFKSKIRTSAYSHYYSNIFEESASLERGVFYGDKFKAPIEVIGDTQFVSTTHYDKLEVAHSGLTFKDIRFLLDGHEEYDENKVFLKTATMLPLKG